MRVAYERNLFKRSPKSARSWRRILEKLYNLLKADMESTAEQVGFS